MANSKPTVPSAPFKDAAALKTFFADMYAFGEKEGLMAGMGLVAEFYRIDPQAIMNLPAKNNSGKVGTFASEWFSGFPYVDMTAQHVDVDDVCVGDDGYSVIFWGRWSAKCKPDGSCTFKDGSVVSLNGNEFKDLRYAYRLTFDKESKQVTLFEGLADTAEAGRLMGSNAYALAVAINPLYTQ